MADVKKLRIIWVFDNMAIKKSELYSSLWEACDELRGGIEPAAYKDYDLSAPLTNYFFDTLKYFYGGRSINVLELTRIKLFIIPLYVIEWCKFHRP